MSKPPLNLPLFDTLTSGIGLSQVASSTRLFGNTPALTTAEIDDGDDIDYSELSDDEAATTKALAAMRRLSAGLEVMSKPPDPGLVCVGTSDCKCNVCLARSIATTLSSVGGVNQLIGGAVLVAGLYYLTRRTAK